MQKEGRLEMLQLMHPADAQGLAERLADEINHMAAPARSRVPIDSPETIRAKVDFVLARRRASLSQAGGG